MVKLYPVCSIPFNTQLQLAQLVSAKASDRKVAGLKTGLDSDHILSPITNWFAGVNKYIVTSYPNMLRCVWT
jgi:hypothetical protein